MCSLKTQILNDSKRGSLSAPSAASSSYEWVRSERPPATEIRGPGKDASSQISDPSSSGAAGAAGPPSSSALVASELYDHYGDDGVGAAAYDDFENVNLAHEPARRAQVQALAARLRAQFERAPGC